MLHPLFTPDHESFRATVRCFVDNELAPHASEWEREGFPDWVFKRLGDLGLLGPRHPVEYGGLGGDWGHAVVVAEEMARCGSGGVGMAVAVQADVATPPILRLGTEEQKQRYLVPAIAGEKIACVGITEADWGSDIGTIETTARRAGGHFVVNGSKTFVTNGLRAHFCVLAARTDADIGQGGVSLFLVDTDTPGFSVSELRTVGMRSSDTAALAFDDMRVPAGSLLGTEGGGLYEIERELQGERLVAAARAVADGWLVFDEALDHVKERTAFGRRLSDFQVIRHKFATMATELEAARQLVYDAALAWERSEDPAREVAMAKLFAGLVVNRAVNECLQIFGGHGYATETGIERAWRDARLLRIAGGADEQMREVIAATMGTGSG